MSLFVFINNLRTTLINSIASGDTFLTLASTSGLPTLSAGQVMPLTLNDQATGLVYEVVYVTAISGAVLTVIRGQEGTIARSWGIGDWAFSDTTAQTVAPVIGYTQPITTQNLPVGNSLVAQPGTLTASIVLTLPSGVNIGAKYRTYGSSSAFQVSVIPASGMLLLPDNSSAGSWTIPASSPGHGIECIWDGFNWRCSTFGWTVVANPVYANQALNMATGDIRYELQSRMTTDVETIGDSRYAALAGNSGQPFSAANGLSGNHVVNISQFSSSLGVNGWGLLPDGRIEQWGLVDWGSGQPEGLYGPYSFPIEFPHAFLNIEFTTLTPEGPGNDGAGDNVIMVSSGYRPTNSQFWIWNNCVGDTNATQGCYWKALGY